MHLGATLRLLRIDAGLSVRGLASRVGVSAAYLSRVEHGQDPSPTPERLRAIARELGVAPAALLAADPLPPALLEEVAGQLPSAGSLLLEMARLGLGAAEVAEVRRFVRARFGARATVEPAPRLGGLVTPNRVLLGVRCDDVDDLLDIAAARLSSDVERPAREIAAALRAREEEAPTTIGRGAILPHAVLAGVKPLLFLATLAPALPAPGDDDPIRFAAVLLSPARGPEHVRRLADLTALVRRGLGEQLSALQDPAAAAEALRRLEEAG